MGSAMILFFHSIPFTIKIQCLFLWRAFCLRDIKLHVKRRIFHSIEIPSLHIFHLGPGCPLCFNTMYFFELMLLFSVFDYSEWIIPFADFRLKYEDLCDKRNLFCKEVEGYLLARLLTQLSQHDLSLDCQTNLCWF